MENEMLNQLLGRISGNAFWFQVLTIAGLFVLGYFLIQMIRSEAGCNDGEGITSGGGINDTWQCLLAFPAGLASFSVLSLLLLTMGIEYNRITVPVFGSVIVAEIFLMLKKQDTVFLKPKWKMFLILLAAVILIAAVCTSGMMSVSIENDSLYYYSAYPEVIVKEGAYRTGFDVFLTDVGPTAVLLNCIPYFFGFYNTFGIQHFININFLMIFLAAVYEESRKLTDQKNAAAISVLSTAFLGTSAAYLTTAKWIMAGDYFMVYFFIVMYLGYREGISLKRHQDFCILLTLFTVMMSMLRMEGVIMTLFLVLCLSALAYSGEELFKTFLFPVGTAAFLYYFCVFVRLQVKPLYAFLTPIKAVFMFMAVIIFEIYTACLRGKKIMARIESHMNIAIPGLLILANAAMLVLRHRVYLNNIYVFFMNVRLRNGWGWFGYFLAAAVILVIVMSVIKKDHTVLFPDMIFAGYILMAIGSAWGRGDLLHTGVGDSGNRVMLTVAPLAVYAVTLRLVRAFRDVRDAHGRE